jgi:hypothetical protein
MVNIKELKAEIKTFKNHPKITGLKKDELIKVLDDLKSDVVGGSFSDLFSGKIEKDYRVATKTVLGNYGQQPIASMMAVRTPIMSVVDKALNVISLGAWNKYKVDDLFHLGLLVTLQDGTVLVVEKLEKINIAKASKGYVKKNSETMPIDMQKKRITLFDLMNNARRRFGESRYFSYDGFKNNCQDFLMMLLNASNLETADNKAFIKQPLEQLIKKLPSYVPKVAKVVTDVANKATEVLGMGKCNCDCHKTGGSSDILDLRKYLT